MLIKPISKTAIIYKNVLNLNSELAPCSVKFFFLSSRWMSREQAKLNYVRPSV